MHSNAYNVVVIIFLELNNMNGGSTKYFIQVKETLFSAIENTSFLKLEVLVDKNEILMFRFLFVT